MVEDYSYGGIVYDVYGDRNIQVEMSMYRLQPVQTEVQIIFVSLTFLQIARGSKEAGKIGPKKSIMKGRKRLAFCLMKKS